MPTDGLVRYFRLAPVWVLRNPILWLVVLFVLTFNEIDSRVFPATPSFDLLRPDSIYVGAIEVAEAIMSLRVLAALGALLLLAGALTIFAVASTFVIFSGRPRPFRAALAAAFSPKTITFTTVEILGYSLFSVAFLAWAALVTRVWHLDGIAGTLAIGAALCCGYPIFYMLMSVLAVLIGADTSLREKIYDASLFLQFANLRRLTAFYLLRIGCELAFAYLALLISSAMFAPPLVMLAIALLAVAVPIATVRTAGFILMLSILRGSRWFSEYFKSYYAALDQGLGVPVARRLA